jgi:hypothetical protein
MTTRNGNERPQRTCVPDLNNGNVRDMRRFHVSGIMSGRPRDREERRDDLLPPTGFVPSGPRDCRSEWPGKCLEQRLPANVCSNAENKYNLKLTDEASRTEARDFRAERAVRE